MLATQNGHLATVRLLLKNKADINVGDHLGGALYSNRERLLVKALLKNGSDPEAVDYKLRQYSSTCRLLFSDDGSRHCGDTSGKVR